MSQKKCQFTKEDGTRCGGWAITNDDFCFVHSSKVSEDKKRMARIKGGQRVDPLLPKKSLKTPQDVASQLESVCNLVRQNKITPNKATLIQKLSDGLLKAMELGEIEDRISQLERKHK